MVPNCGFFAMAGSKTSSVCPECSRAVPARYIRRGGRVFLEKECPEHGRTSELYWSDAGDFERFSRYMHDFRSANPSFRPFSSCPESCGLCENHKSNTVIGIIDVTNRCNLDCWYCFANANRQGFVFEPPKGKVLEMMDFLAGLSPRRCHVVQFSGGEPLIRRDIAELVQAAGRKGFSNVLIATNGLMLARKPGLARKLRIPGANTIIYLKCNGLTPRTNPENLGALPAILAACRDAGLIVVLVPTIAKGFNDCEVGGIIRFALANLGVVGGVNFQPISFSGKAPRPARLRQRYTIPDLFRDVEEQTGGAIRGSSFLPIPAEMPLSEFVEGASGWMAPYFSCHPHCGAFTYVFRDGDRFSDYSEYFDLPQFLSGLRRLGAARKLRLGPAAKAAYFVGIAALMRKCERKRFSGMDTRRVLTRLLTKIDLSAGKEFDNRFLFVGTMHFMDKYNFDCARAERCVVHYATPGLSLIPFCAYNNMGYREETERAHAAGRAGRAAAPVTARTRTPPRRRTSARARP
jgi:uncharacterized radical SAM superfamily Fe-S cluster-containing enzyme